MPTKRAADESGRPPLSRGSACHRCFARKVRCSGQPDPATGVHACSSCLRTARFKNHDIALVKCAFNGEGLCSEEGGVQLNGESLPSAAGPTRRKLGSRTSTGASNRSTSSRASSSSSRSDLSIASSRASSTETVSPPTSTESVPTVAKLELDLPQPPSLFDRSSSSFQFPPSFASSSAPPPAHFTSLYETPYPPSLQISTSHPNSNAPSTTSSARGSRSASPMTPVDPPPSLFARRAGAPMQISLPRRPGHSPTGSISKISSVAPSLDSAPLQTPASWGQMPSATTTYPQNGFAPCPSIQLPLTQVALDLAPYSALSPSALSKFNAASVPSFDFSVPPPQFASGSTDFYAPTTVGGALGMDQYASYPPPSAAPFEYQIQQQQYSQYNGENQNHLPFAPSTPYRQVDQFSLDDPSGLSFDPASFAGSFHLPSPGLTFSSSTPSWLAKNQYFCA